MSDLIGVYVQVKSDVYDKLRKMISNKRKVRSETKAGKRKKVKKSVKAKPKIQALIKLVQYVMFLHEKQ